MLCRRVTGDKGKNGVEGCTDVHRDLRHLSCVAVIWSAVSSHRFDTSRSDNEHGKPFPVAALQYAKSKTLLCRDNGETATTQQKQRNRNGAKETAQKKQRRFATCQSGESSPHSKLRKQQRQNSGEWRAGWGWGPTSWQADNALCRHYERGPTTYYLLPTTCYSLLPNYCHFPTRRRLGRESWMA